MDSAVLPLWSSAWMSAPCFKSNFTIFLLSKRENVWFYSKVFFIQLINLLCFTAVRSGFVSAKVCTALTSLPIFISNSTVLSLSEINKQYIQNLFDNLLIFEITIVDGFNERRAWEGFWVHLVFIAFFDKKFNSFILAWKYSFY